MLTLIAESKTMLEREGTVSPSEFEAHTPAGGAGADAIMARVDAMTATDIAAAVKVSGAMAAKIKRMAYEFPNKQAGLRAIEAFTGVVFRYLRYDSFNDAARAAVARDVRIISSLYGWLKSDDIIKPYRFDYTTPLALGDEPLACYWRGDVTALLIAELQHSGTSDILDLLPGDAEKCIDFKQVQKIAKIWKVDFKEHDGSTVRTPHAGKLKALRGELLREIIIRGITGPEELMQIETDNLMPGSIDETKGLITYIV